MKKQKITTIVTALVALGMVGSSTAATVFSATTGNTTAIDNGHPDATISGATPDLLVTHGNATNNNMSGFTSTADINTLNGTPLTALDTVTISMTIDSITGATIRSNGIEFGMSSSIGFRPTSSFLLGLAGSNSGSDVRIVSSSFQDGGTLDFNANQASLEDGFTVTLTADAAGYSFVLEDILVAGSTNPLFTDGDTTATISGTFAGTEFLDNFSTGYFYSAVQQFNGTAVVDYSAATIDVTAVPEPSSTALLGLAGLALIMRRRK